MTIACFYSNMEIAGARGRSRRVFRGPPPTRAHHIGTAGRAGVPRREIDRGFAAASPVRPRNVLRIASAHASAEKSEPFGLISAADMRRSAWRTRDAVLRCAIADRLVVITRGNVAQILCERDYPCVSRCTNARVISSMLLPHKSSGTFPEADPVRGRQGMRAEPMSTLDAELNDFGAQLAMLGGHAADRDG